MMYFIFVRTPVCRRTLTQQYPGCLTRAKYGPKDAPPTACQVHKRAGQYTINRHGEMLIATRDGDGKDASPGEMVAPGVVFVGRDCRGIFLSVNSGTVVAVGHAVVLDDIAVCRSEGSLL